MVGSEPVAGVMEIGTVGAIIDGFEDHMHDLLHNFIPHAWHAEFSHFAVWLGNKVLPHGFELKLLGSHLVDDLSDCFERKSIESFLVRSWRHVSGLRLDPFVGHTIQVFLVHEPVHIVVHPGSVAIQLS